MKLNDLAFNRGETFSKNLQKEIDSSTLETIFNEFIYYSRLYNDSWNQNFSKGFFYNINKKDFDFYYNFYESFFNEYYSVSHTDIENIKFIIQNRSTFNFSTKNKNDFENFYDFIFYKRTIFFKKILYEICYFFSNIDSFSNKKDLFSFFDSINKISLTQKLFKSNNEKYTFHIPKNKGPFFSFWINKKMINIDPFISYKINKKMQINSFIFSLLSTDKNPKSIQKNIITLHKEYPTIIENKTKEIILENIFQNDEDFLYFSFEELKPLTGIFDLKDELILKQLSLENNFYFSNYISETFYENLFTKKSQVKTIFYSTTESLEKRKYWINKFFTSLFFEENFYNLLTEVNKIDQDIFLNIYKNTINKIKEINNISDHHNTEFFFNEFCFESSNDFHSFLIKLKENFENKNNILYYINNEEDQSILFNSLTKLLKTS